MEWVRWRERRSVKRSVEKQGSSWLKWAGQWDELSVRSLREDGGCFYTREEQTVLPSAVKWGWRDLKKVMWGLCASKNNMCCGRDVATDWIEFPNRKSLKFAEKQASAWIWNSVSRFLHSLMMDSTVSVLRPWEMKFCPVCYNREELFQKSVGYSSLRVDGGQWKFAQSNKSRCQRKRAFATSQTPMTAGYHSPYQNLSG